MVKGALNISWASWARGNSTLEKNKQKVVYPTSVLNPVTTLILDSSCTNNPQLTAAGAICNFNPIYSLSNGNRHSKNAFDDTRSNCGPAKSEVVADLCCHSSHREWLTISSKGNSVCLRRQGRKVACHADVGREGGLVAIQLLQTFIVSGFAYFSF